MFVAVVLDGAASQAGERLAGCASEHAVIVDLRLRRCSSRRSNASVGELRARVKERRYVLRCPAYCYGSGAALLARAQRRTCSWTRNRERVLRTWRVRDAGVGGKAHQERSRWRGLCVHTIVRARIGIDVLPVDDWIGRYRRETRLHQRRIVGDRRDVGDRARNLSGILPGRQLRHDQRTEDEERLSHVPTW